MRPAPGVSAEHPWPGLMPFTEEAQAFFHGRDHEIAELVRLIRRETLTVLFGLSGLGKSSLLNAGLFPRLRREDFHPAYLRLDLLSGRSLPAQAMATLQASFATHRVEAPAPREFDTLWEYFHRRDAEFWSPRNRLVTPVLVFDQFEEIFTLGRRDEAASRACRELVDQVADLVEGRVPLAVATRLDADPGLAAGLDFARTNCKVVLSFREDYLPEFEALRSLIPSIMRGRLRLTRMNGMQACEAILLSGGRLVSEPAAEHIVRFVASPRVHREEAEPELERLEVEPALMSVVCRELNNKRIRAGRPQITSDLLEGGAQHEIIREFYEDSLEGIDPRVREFVEDQLLTEAGYRDSYALEDALRLPGVVREAIDQLIARRLLRLDERSGVLRVELTHDVLTRVAKESRDRRQERQNRQRMGELEAARRRRTRRFAFAGGGVIAAALALAAVFAVLLDRSNVERRRLIETQSNVMLEQAIAQLDRNVPGEPQAMLAESLRLNPANQAAAARLVSYVTQRSFPRAEATFQVSRAADRRGLRLAWEREDTLKLAGPGGSATVGVKPAAKGHAIALEPAPGAADGVARSRDGLWSATVQRDTVLVSNVLSGAHWALRHPSPVNSIDFSPDGRFIATGCQDRNARVWDLASGSLAAGPLAHEGAVLSVAFNDSGSRLVTGSLDRTARLWSLPSGHLVLEPMNADAAVLDARLSPSGKLAATLDAGGKLALWNVDQGVGHEAGGAPARRFLAASADGSVVVAESGDANDPRALALWRAGPGGASPPAWQTLAIPAESAGPMAFSGDSRRVAFARPGWVEVRNVRDASTVRKIGVPGVPVALALDREGHELAVGGDDGAIRIYDLESGALLGLPIPGAGRVAQMCFEPEGRLLAIVDEGGTIEIWDAASSLLATKIAPAMPGARVAFVGFTEVPGEIVAVDERMARVVTLGGPEGQSFATAVESGSLEAVERARIGFQNTVWSAGVGAKARRLVVGGIDGVARIVDLDTMRVVGAPMKHDGVVLAAGFTTVDDRWIVTRTDNTVRVWDGRSGYAVADALRAPSRIVNAALVADGAALVSQDSGASMSQRALDLDFPLPAARWLGTLGEVIGGSRVDASGSIVPVQDAPGERAKLRQAVAGEDSAPWWKSWGEGALRKTASP